MIIAVLLLVCHSSSTKRFVLLLSFQVKFIYSSHEALWNQLRQFVEKRVNFGHTSSFCSKFHVYFAGCVQDYGSDVSLWTRQQLINAAGVVTGLTPSEIGTLKLHDIESISAVGNNGKWTSTQVSQSITNIFDERSKTDG